MKRGFKTWAEKQAVFWRHEVDLEPWALLPSLTLAGRLKIKIISPTEVEGLSAASRDLLLNHRSTEWSAVTITFLDSRHVVIENTAHTSKRRESTRMHEMAHIICGHKPQGFEAVGDLGLVLRRFDREQEDEADWLGRCLHLPQPVLGWCLNRNYTHQQISDHCKASEELVCYRLNTSGALIIRRRAGVES